MARNEPNLNSQRKGQLSKLDKMAAAAQQDYLRDENGNSLLSGCAPNKLHALNNKEFPTYTKSVQW